jgi:hypothetical protein
MRQYRKLYQEIATLLQAIENCKQSNNNEWLEKHSAALLEIEKNYLPSGSGIDCGTKIDYENSTSNKIILFFEFHHMNDCGMYCGWTEHKAIIRPDLINGIELKITGKDRNDIKDYLYQEFDSILNSTDYDINRIYNLLIAKNPAKAEQYKIVSNWKNHCILEIVCNHIVFKNWNEAKLYAITELD